MLNPKRFFCSSSRLFSGLAFGFLTFFVSQAQASSWIPLTEQTAQKPLAYFRTPLPWQGLSGDPNSLASWKASLLDKVIPQTVLGKASRAVLMRVESSLEILVLPPANRFLPIPSMVISMDMSGGEERQKLLEQWVIATMSQVQGSPANWLKFKDVASNKTGRKIREVFLPGGRCWVQVEGKRATLFYSSNMDFLKSFEQKIKSKKTMPESHTRQDFRLLLKPQQAFSFYDGWLKRVAKPIHEAYLDSPLSKVKSFDARTQGEGSAFETIASLDWSSSEKSIFSLLPKRDKKVELPSSEFRGGFKFPSLEAKAWSEQLPHAWLVKIPRLPFLLSSMKEVSFGWSEKDVAPIMKLTVKDVESFEKGLASLFGPKVTHVKEGHWHHLHWGANRLSYQIEGKFIWFSPLQHALKDKTQKDTILAEKPELWLEYPLAGRLSGNHYSLMHLYLQLALLKGQGLNPNLYPAFAEQNVKDALWKGMGSLSLKIEDDGLALRWSQPYGLAGLMGGIQLQSSSWAYFLSLLQLTKHSF